MRRTGFAAALLASAAALPAFADDRAALDSELKALQERVDALEKRRRVAPAATVEQGAKPRSWKLPGTNTSMQVGGYAKLDIIYDINASSGDSMGFTALPIDGTAAGNQQGNFRIHARQSRLWIKTWSPTDWGELATHLEGDFFGGGGNQLISNSNAFRLRHAYGRLGPVMAGMSWSTFYIVEALPETLDFTGPVGAVFVRQAQVRYTHSFGGGTLLDISVENPETGFVTAPGGLPAAGALLPSNDPVPDFVVKLSQRYSNGYVAIAGLFRRLNVDDGGAGGLSSSTFGWGGHIGGWFQFNKKRTVIGGSIVGGRGLGRYVIQGRTSSILNGTSSATQSLNAVASVSGQIWLTNKISERLRGTIAFGRSWTDVTGANTTGAGGKAGLGALVRDAWSFHANMIWSVTPQFLIGAEYIYGFNGVINSPNAKAHRLQMSFRYNF